MEFKNYTRRALTTLIACISLNAMAMQEKNPQNFANQLRKQVEQNNFTPAITTAIQWIQSEDTTKQKEALMIYRDLVLKNQAFEPAITAAELEMQSDNFDVLVFAANLIVALLEKGQGYELAIPAADILLHRNKEQSLQSKAFSIYQALVKKDQAIDKAIEFACNGIKKNHSDIRYDALQLWKTLFEKKQGFNQAIATANRGIQLKSLPVQQSSLNLLQKLIENWRGSEQEIQTMFEQAIAVATQGIKKEDNKTQNAAQRLWIAINEQDLILHKQKEYCAYATPGKEVRLEAALEALNQSPLSHQEIEELRTIITNLLLRNTTAMQKNLTMKKAHRQLHVTMRLNQLMQETENIKKLTTAMCHDLEVQPLQKVNGDHYCAKE